MVQPVAGRATSGRARARDVHRGRGGRERPADWRRRAAGHRRDRPAADAKNCELTQARLRTTREESEAANEELRAANEELQSINEEYRSTSEELETSKEELQSINEELQTVNTELKLKLDAISRAHSDLQNLMAATDIGTLFLDPSCASSASPTRVTDLFNVTPATRAGRSPISRTSSNTTIWSRTRAPCWPISRRSSARCAAASGRWYDVRMRPYRTVDDKIDGVVITFVDITERLQVEEALRQQRARGCGSKSCLVDLSRDPIFVWDFDGGILEWNRGCEELYGFSARRRLGKKIDEAAVHRRSRLFDRGDARHAAWRGDVVRRIAPAGKGWPVLPVESRLHLEEIDGKRVVLETGRDIGDRKGWEDRQEMLLNELKHRVKNILAVVQAVAGQTANETGAGKEFLTTFRGRVAALASAQDLLAQSEWHGADLRRAGPRRTQALRV